MNLRKRAISGIMLAGSMVVRDCRCSQYSFSRGSSGCSRHKDGLSYRWDSRCCCTVKPDKHRYSGDGSSRD